MFEWHSWWGTIILFVLVVIGVTALLFVVRAIALTLSRRAEWVRQLFDRLFLRLATLLSVLGLWITSALTAPEQETWWPALSHGFLIATILTGAWFVSGIVSFSIARVTERISSADDTDPTIRRRRTQLTVVRRLAVVVITVVAIGVVLFTFPSVRAVGASVLASAGIISVIAGLAAQSTLGNLFAGIQLAFTDAIRVGDVVVVEGEWGRIGEITLSYVVVNIWDERRLILPCTYFTTTPIETWTRRSDKVLGTVFMDLDWRVPVDEVRAKFQEVLEASPLWDRRTSNALMTGSQGGLVTMRFMMSAANSGDQWGLRCHVREEIVKWLQAEHPKALPTTRVAMATSEPEAEPESGSGSAA